MGFEPMTCGLRNRCSTTELRWRCGAAYIGERAGVGKRFVCGSARRTGTHGFFQRELVRSQDLSCEWERQLSTVTFL